MSQLLVVAGEPSGDGFGAAVLAALKVHSWGVGGPQMARFGLECLADLPSVMGLRAGVTSLPRLYRTYRRLLAGVDAHRPLAALLVGFSEFNGLLARQLRRRDVPTLWYAPPQVWAWRRHRARPISRQVTQVATLFRFEAELWRDAGAHAHHVGHPSAQLDGHHRDALRTSMRLLAGRRALALLPGSRPNEVAKHALPMLQAAELLRDAGQVETIHLALAPSLPYAQEEWIRRTCERSDVSVIEGPAASKLAAFDCAIVCSGTASLECAMSEVPAVVVYDCGPFTQLGKRALLHTSYIGLPNLLLEEGLFPELLGGMVRATSIAHAVMTRLPSVASTRAARQRLLVELDPSATPGSTQSTSSTRVANLLRQWIR